MKRFTLQMICLSAALRPGAGALRAADGPDGCIRVACLGDSITYGARVKRDTHDRPGGRQEERRPGRTEPRAGR